MAKGEKKSKKGLIIGIVAAVVVVAALGSQGGNKDDKDSSSKSSSKNEIVSVNKSNDGKKEIKDTDDKKADDEKSNDFTIDEQVLWEIDGLKITATGINEDSIFGTQIKVQAENNSDKDIGIGTDAVIVNDYMINDLTSIQVTAGNKANDEITLFSSELNAAGIESIGKVELYMHTYDPNTFQTISESGCITIETSDIDKIDAENNIEGTVLFEQDGVKIVGQYVDENSFWGSAVLLYVENNSDQNIIVQCDDVAVNGFMVSALMSDNVYAGKKCLTDITLLGSDLEENGITEIETIETSFKILDENFSEIANSGKVSFSTK